MVKKKEKSSGVLGLVIVLIVIIALLGTFIFLFRDSSNSKLTEGVPAVDFCTPKCGDYDYYISNNNTGFGFIRCECLISSQGDAHPVHGARVNIETEVYYFDSQTQEELSEFEVLSRIENGI
ncbi:MAG: hypothetical protein KJ879_01875 [Nanoarchaeota archaeon]|nr:hypothetical protein [Nanoarchaeota archaeon]